MASTWAVATAYSVGDIVVPTTLATYYYECTTAGTGSATEPTWPTTEGSYVTDGTTVWITRAEKIKKIGAKGFTVGATLSTDSDQWYYEAEKHDSVAPEKDAASYDPVGKHPNS